MLKTLHLVDINKQKTINYEQNKLFKLQTIIENL